jgi:hypothetical protein
LIELAVGPLKTDCVAELNKVGKLETGFDMPRQICGALLRLKLCGEDTTIVSASQ